MSLVISCAGPRLSPDRYCLIALNYKLQSSIIETEPNQRGLTPHLCIDTVSSRSTTLNITT